MQAAVRANRNRTNAGAQRASQAIALLAHLPVFSGLGVR